jgi:hypothetical protein
MRDLLPALMPLAARVRQDITWRRVGKQTRCERTTPLTKSLLKRHLRGMEARGVCPIEEGGTTTRVAVLDLDSHRGETEWEVMQFTTANICRYFEEIGYHPIAFRSTGGHGVHIFFIWDKTQDAFSVRRFFQTHLKDCGFKEGTKGIARGEIEIFPKQDFVPMGGCGSQFILPLSGLSVPLEPLLGYEPVEPEAALDITWTADPDVPFIEKQKTKPQIKLQHYENMSPELRRMLEAIPNAEANYELWIKIGMALHAETSGSNEGLALWELWSEKCPDYSGFEELQYKWNSFRADKDKIVTVGSLKKIASEHGWQEDYSVDFNPVPEEEPKEPEQENRRFQLLPVDKFVKRPLPRWLIKGVLPEKSTGMTYGGSGDGKTFAILDMACAIALGGEWQGRKVEKGHVVYICAEGSGSFTTRLLAYCIQHKVSPEKLGENMTIIPAAPNFLQKKDVEELISEINAFNKRTDLIIIDTMAQTTTGADENSAKDMNIALKYLEALRSKTNSAAHLIHHAGKNEDRGARGSSTLKAALDVQFRVSREGDKRLFWVDKMKDGVDGFGWNFSLEVGPTGRSDEDGFQIDSCYVKFEEKEVSKRPVARKEERSYAEIVLLNTWEALGSNAIALNDLVAAAVEAIPHVEGAKDNRASDLNKAMGRLVLLGELTIKDGQVVNDLGQI